MPVALTRDDLARVCRDIAWSEIAAMPGHSRALGPRISPAGHTVSWDQDNLYLDSLARMQLATAAATWCNAYDAGFEDLFLAKRSSANWAEVMGRARLAGAAHFTFATSGSTGTRKFIRHREDVLAAEALAWLQVLEQVTRKAPGTPISRVIVLAPTHHIYGFIWGVLLPLALGVPALDADISALPPLQSGDLMVAVPDQWAWLSASHKSSTLNPSSQNLGSVWPDSVYGVSSTAPLPKVVHEQLAMVNMSGQGRPALHSLLQIYGSSETAGLAWRADPDHGYTLAPGRTRTRTGTSQGGINLQLPDGASVSLAIQDELNWLNDTDFQLLRRTDHTVQVGGHNVSPDWVAAQLMSHPAVRQAAVRLHARAVPPRLKAFVVLHMPDNTDQREELEVWAVNQLPWYAAPCAIRYGAELPKNALGKASDWPD
jgi:long-chain acyl-CoA synthetase